MSDVSNRTPPLNDGERDKSTDSGIVSSNRRRLLTGAAALPVIMTLPTNASAAAFGSALTCLNNTNTQPADVFAIAPNGWATKPLDTIQVSRPNNSDPWTLGVFDGGKLFDRAGTQWYTDGTWYAPNSYPSATNRYKKDGTGSGYKYIYVGPSDGQVWGTDPKYRTMGGVVPYGSCYVSLVGV